MDGVFSKLGTAMDLLAIRKGLLAQITVPGPGGPILLQAPPPPSTSPYPIDPAHANVPYHLLQQASSHNSYQTEVHGDLTLTEQFQNFGIHSFELDIHIGDPGGPGSDLFGDTTQDGDYYVYHDSSDEIAAGPLGDFILGQLGLGSGTNYASLQQGLQEIYALDNDYPVTLFVDVKDDLNGEHGSALLDSLLQGELQDKIFTPQDYMDWAGVDNLQDAVAHGWPTAEELNGRVIVVLTGHDKLPSYTEGNDSQAAFIAPSPDIYVNPDGSLDFTPQEDAVFYNTSNPDYIDEVREDGYPIRVYDFEHPNADAQDTGANHIGTDNIDPSNNGYPDDPSDTNPFNVLDEPVVTEDPVFPRPVPNPGPVPTPEPVPNVPQDPVADVDVPDPSPIEPPSPIATPPPAGMEQEPPVIADNDLPPSPTPEPVPGPGPGPIQDS